MRTGHQLDSLDLDDSPIAPFSFGPGETATPASHYQEGNTTFIILSVQKPNLP